MNILDSFESLLIHTVGARRSIDGLDSENQPGPGKIWTGSGALGLTEDDWQQKYWDKKEEVQNYLKYSFEKFLKISLRSR